MAVESVIGKDIRRVIYDNYEFPGDTQSARFVDDCKNYPYWGFQFHCHEDPLGAPSPYPIVVIVDESHDTVTWHWYETLRLELYEDGRFETLMKTYRVHRRYFSIYFITADQDSNLFTISLTTRKGYFGT